VAHGSSSANAHNRFFRKKQSSQLTLRVAPRPFAILSLDLLEALVRRSGAAMKADPVVRLNVASRKSQEFSRNQANCLQMTSF